MEESKTNLALNFFQEIINNIPLAICVKTYPEFSIKYANYTFESFVRKRTDELIGKKDFEIFSPDVAKVMQNFDSKVVSEKKSMKFSINNPFGNNPNLVVEVQKTPLYSKSNNEVEYIIDYYQNITQQTSADKILRETELLYKKIFENLPLGIVLIRADDYTIIDVNTNFLNTFELEFDKVMYKPVYELPFCFEKERIATYFNIARELDCSQVLEKTYTLPSGRVVSVLFSIFFVKFLENEPWYVLVANDISALEEANQEILAHIKKEQELNRLKNRFVSMISHELKTPLTAISLSVDILQKFGDKIDVKEKERNFEQINNSIKAIANLLENVSRLEKLTDSDFPLNFNHISFKDILIKICKEIELAHNVQNRINIQFTVEDEFPIFSDEVLLEIILTNLLNNAVKFSFQEAKINIIVSKTNGNIQVSIQNFGEPIPPNEINHVFTPFYRGSNSKKAKGYGIGLSLVKKALELLGGSIEITSSSEEGTIVKITIPKEIKSPKPA